MKKRLFLLIMLLTGILFAEKLPFSIEALYELKSVSNPQISPDGKWIALTVTEYDLFKSKQNTDVFLISSDGKISRRLTTFPGADFNPIWSKDGKWLYFLSTREKGVQLWKLPVDGGEAQKVTELDVNGLNNLHILQNGKVILFSTKVFPECNADLKCSSTLRKQMENGPVQAYYARELLYRHWTEYREEQMERTFLYFVEQDSAVLLTPWEFDAPMFSLGGETMAVSPDESEICVVANADKDKASSTNGDLWIISLKTGEWKNITAENPAWDGEPAYSPDGRYIAFKNQKIPGYESDLFRLSVFDRKTNKFIHLTDGKLDNWVGEIVWSPDSRYIYFTVEEKGVYPIYRVEVKTGKMKKIFEDKTIRSLRISPDGSTFYFTRSSINEPYELYSVPVNGNKLTRITTFNKEVEDKYDLRPAQMMWITGADGKKIQTWVITPYDFDPSKKYPLIINVHGGPQQMWYDGFRGDWQVYPGHGYVVAFCNPHGSPGYGQDFVAAISKDWGGKVYEDIMKVVDSLATLPFVDENRLGAMGWSYGGYMMMWLEGHTDRFKAIVAMMGVYDLVSMYGATEELWFPEWEMGGPYWEQPELYKKWSPSSYVKNFKTPCLVITGERDYRVPYTQSLQFFTALQKMNVPSELIVFKNDGHWPNYLKSMPLYYNAHLYWFHKYLGGKPAPFSMDDMIKNKIFQ